MWSGTIPGEINRPSGLPMPHTEKPTPEKYDAMIAATARRAQEDFRKSYRDPEGAAHRIKITKDESWIRQHGTDHVDMAILDYRELPSDWQFERKVAAQISLDAVLGAVEEGKPLDENFIETTAEVLHDQWLERNQARATDIQKG